jgi:transcription-repair coupling factor (superfamily II helicase)
LPEASAPGSPSLRSTRSVLDAWQRFDDSVRIQGSTESARSLALLDLARQSSAPWVVFCPDEKELASRVDDLRHLQKAWPEMADVKVLTLPHGDTSVYGTARARTHIRFERTATLCADWNEPTLVLTTLMGWNKKLPPVSDLRGDPLSVQLGESLEREELVEHLATRGYLRVDPCEDKGTFAIRGDIVEFFSPQLEHPIRVEFFGDEIERIRAFDPSSQRPIGESLEKTTILPAREVVLSTESRKKLRTALKAYADDHAVSRKARDPVLQDLDFGSYIDHSESMACWAFSATTGPSEYLPIETRFAWIDPHRCVQEWDEWWQEQLELAQLALKSDLLIPPPGQLYFELEDQLIEGKALRFEVFGLGAETETETETEVISDDYRVSTRQHWTSSRAGLLRGVLPGDPDRLAKQVTDWVKDGYDVTLFCGTQTESDRMQFFFQERAPEIESAIRLAPTSIGESLIWPEEKMVFLLLPELRGKKAGARSRSRHHPLRTGPDYKISLKSRSAISSCILNTGSVATKDSSEWSSWVRRQTLFMSSITTMIGSMFRFIG